MKKLFILPILLMLGACDPTGGQVIRANSYIVISPPAELYNCPVVRVPDTKGLTNQDVARFILQQYKANVTCYNSLMAIKKYADQVKKIYTN